jgi:hypothetical protein
MNKNSSLPLPFSALHVEDIDDDRVLTKHALKVHLTPLSFR